MKKQICSTNLIPVLCLAFFLAPKDAMAATVSISCSPTSVIINGTCSLTMTSGATATTSTPTICSVSGTTVTGLAAGSCSVTGAKSGSTSKTISITVNKKPQTIGTPTFSPSLAYVGDVATVSATATSGLAVTFSTTTPTICTVSSTTVTAIAAGTCTIKSNQAGNATWAAATQLSTNVTIAKKSQTITFATPAFNPATLLALGTSTVSATASSGLTVVFTSATTSVCTVSGSTVTGVTSGTCTINANVAATTAYNAAAQVQKSITIGKRSQTITGSFNPTTLVVGGGTTILTATSLDTINSTNTGLAVTLTNQTPSICSMSTGNSPRTITSTTRGTCTIRATQAGTTAYNAATTVDFSIAVTGKPQTIGPVSFSINPIYLTGVSIVSATASSGLQVIFSSLTPSICTVSAPIGTGANPTTATVTASLTSGGTCTIAANQAGTTIWDPAAQMTGDLTVINGRFTLTIEAEPPDPTTIYATKGMNSAPAIITVVPIGAFNSAVALSAFSGVPTNTVTIIDPTTIPAGSHTATLTFAPNLNAGTGIYTVTIRGTSGGITYDQTIILKIIAANGGWIDFNYMTSATDDVYTTDCGGSSYGAVNRCTLKPPYDVDWRMRSADVNVMYYNPSTTYMPWPGFPNASFTAARSNPQSGRTGYTVYANLTGTVYEVATDDSGFSGTKPRRGTNTNKTTAPNSLIDLWDTHIRYTVDANSITKTTYIYDNIITSGVNVGLNPTITTTTLTDPDICYEDLGSNGQCRTIAETQQNIANWHQYYRRRSLTTKAAIGNVITNTPNYRYGLNVINSSTSLFKDMPAASVTDFTAHNSALLTSLYSFAWPGNGTPLQLGLDRAGQYYKGGLVSGHLTSPIISRCQQNFTILMTDGYWNGTIPAGIANQDGDSYSDTLADVAYKYYKDDLTTAYENVVPTSLFDLANWQHMVTFTVALGVNGALEDVDGDGWPNPPLTESSNWGNPSCSDCPQKIDDMWHAAYNSRGTFVSAQSPQELQQAMSNALASVSVRIGTAASIATNSTSLDADTLIYQAKFDPTDWSGRLVAYPVSETDGSVGTTSVWDTETVPLPAFADRKIYTWNGSTGVQLAWNNLTASQQTALRNGSTVLAGQERLNWILGDQSREQPVGTLRKRISTRRLGDIVNSNPTYASGDIDYGYVDLPFGTPGQDSYESDFLVANESRTVMLYVGANDGILHGFDAGTGEEKFGFMPNAIFPNLQTGATPSLTNSGYGHRYFVDGSPQIGHAYWSGSWHTVLVGSNGAGAKSVFALDVTDPDTFDSSKVLWEFTDTDLGYPINQFIQPVIGRAQNGEWVVIFGNGYESTNKRAVLYVVRVNDGTLVKKIDTLVGNATTPNGMAGPVLVADDYRTLKYAYAGDIQGNLWKFDLSDASSSNWRSGFTSSGSASGTPKPLFQAFSAPGVTQPITAPPDIAYYNQKDASAGYIVVFGTGRFFETTDHIDLSKQTMYGIWDKNISSIECNSIDDPCVFPTDRSTLQQQSITAELTTSGNHWRTVSSNALDWNTKRGWYLNLLKPPSGTTEGERVVTAPMILGGRRVLVITLVPAVQSCYGGGTSWVLQINLDTGGSLTDPVFDTNGDGVVNSDDNNVSAIESTVGIINSLIIISGHLLGAGSTSQVMHVLTKDPTLPNVNNNSGNRSRTSWTQIR